MKQCPQCRRTYSDETLNFCLDDGSILLDGPGAGDNVTEVLHGLETSEGPTRVYDPSDKDRTDLLDSSQRLSKGRAYLLAFCGIILISAILSAGFWLYRPSQSKQITSIAVLPFSNESGTPDAEYLSDGIADSLINSLSKIRA
jgi:hypothetical protein